MFNQKEEKKMEIYEENNVERADYITPVRADVPQKVAAKMEEGQEYDLLKSLFDAASYKEDEEEFTTIEIRRNGEFKFAFEVHPIGDDDVSLARKKATKYYPNPNGKKLPKIAGETDTRLFTSWIIYLATTEKDRKEIWGNREFMKAKNLAAPVESIDALLKMGEKTSISDMIFEISGLDDSEDGPEMSVDEYAKN